MKNILGSGEHRYRVVENWAKLPDNWQLTDVASVAVDSKDRIYVFNRGEHPMVVLDRDGNFLRSFGEGLFSRAHGLHIDADDNLYCTDDGDHTVRKCTFDGKVLLEIGIPGQHHLISHHRDDAELMSQKARIDTYHVQMLAYLLEKMQATPDGDGSLLDHSLIMYGSGMGNGNLHRHSDLPVLLAGKLGGRFKTGYHYDYQMNTPMANLLVTILDRAGVPIEKMGDSTGPLKLETLPA